MNLQKELTRIKIQELSGTKWHINIVIFCWLLSSYTSGMAKLHADTNLFNSISLPSGKSCTMATKWKTKNVNSVNETIKSNEEEISRINNYMNDYFATDAETIKMNSDIQALESENKRLGRLEPSNLSPDEIIALTRANLPPLVGHRKKKQGSLVRIAFIDTTVANSSKMRNAVWKLINNDWQYLRYE